MGRLLPIVSVASLLFVIEGCTVGPDYTPPSPNAPADWNAELPPGLRRDSATLSRWWTNFNDPQLTDLISHAVQGNLGLRQAQERIYEARAQRAIASSGRFPTLSASGSAIRQEFSENSVYSGLTDSFYAAGFDASWELDLFGRIQRQVEASEAIVAASEEDYRNALVTLIAEVALNYVEMRSYQVRLGLLEASSASQEKTLELVQANYEGGEVSRLDLEQAATNLEITRSRIPMIQAALEQSKNRLAVLCGLHPGALEDELATRTDIPVPPPSLAIGVPAEALRRRPDVRRAERELAAQTAEIGVATADLYPRFTLLGSIGLESMGSADLFSVASRVSGIGPAVQWNAFDAGRVRANIDVQTSRQAQALIAYEGTVLLALREVEDSIVAFAKEQVRHDALARAEVAAKETLEIANDRYTMGESSYLVVLDAERSLLSVQDQIAESGARMASYAISLYKALGGGWSALAPLSTATESDDTPSTQEAIPQ